MKKKYKVLLLLLVVLIVVITRFVWIFFGNKYKRLDLLFHKEYITANTDIKLLVTHQKQAYYLVKKYVNSQDYSGFVFTNTTGTRDYYGYGISDANKKTVIPPIYKSIYVFEEPETKDIVVRCEPFLDDGFKHDDFFKIEGSKAIYLKKYEEKQKKYSDELKKIHENELRQYRKNKLKKQP